MISKIFIDNSNRFSKNHIIFTVCYYSGKTVTYYEYELPKTVLAFLNARKDKPEKYGTRELPIFGKGKDYWKIIDVLKEYVVID